MVIIKKNKKFNIKKGFIILYIAYILLLIGDIATTLLNYKYLEHLEVNPIYRWIGIQGIVVINIIVLWFLWYYYPKVGTINRYLFINVMVSTIYLRIIAIRNAMYWYNLQPNIETVAATVTQTIRTEYLISISIAGYFPLIMGMVAFLIYYLDHNIEKKENNYIKIKIRG